MPGIDVFAELDALPKDDPYFYQDLIPLVARWDERGLGSEAIGPILEFIEQHPDIEYGTPGPLVRFMEQFVGEYEPVILESLQRRPTSVALHMVNRRANIEQSPALLRNYIDVLQAVAEHPAADEALREEARDYAEFQLSGGIWGPKALRPASGIHSPSNDN